MSHAQHEIGDDQEHRNKEERDRCTGREIAALNAKREGQGRQGLRGVEWTAGRQDINNRHIRERKNQAEQHGNAHDGPHYGNDNLELRAPEASSIHGGGLGNILGNGGAARKQDDGSKWQHAPTVNQEHGSDGQARFAEPHGSAERLVDVRGYQNPGDHAVDRIQDPFPSNGAQRDGRNPGQKNQKTNQAAATERGFQGQGENVGADDHDDLGADGKDKGIADGNAKTGALQDAAEVFDPNKVHFGIADAGVAESVKDG